MLKYSWKSKQKKGRTMGVSNVQKTIKKIWKNTENTKGFEHFKPNWTLDFEDGTKAKLTLSEHNAAEICGKIAEGRSFLFTLEDGVYNGKNWVAVRDVLASGGMPSPAPTPPAPSAPVSPLSTEKPPVAPQNVNGQAMGNRRTNAVNLVIAQIGAGTRKATESDIQAGLQFWENLFLDQEKTGYYDIPF